MFKVKNVMQNTIKYKAFVLLAAVIAFSSCRKIFNLPDEKNYLSTQASYTTMDWRPIMGRTFNYNNVFSPSGSTFPITFEIKNPRFGDGKDASDMLTVRPVLVWNGEYSGKETSLAEIEAKRHLESHPILEVRSSGDLIWWNSATGIAPTPSKPTPADKFYIKPSDSVIYPQNQRFFDMKFTNSGGSRTIKNLTITPRIDQPYTPNPDYNTFNGLANTTTPGGKIKVYSYANVSGIRGATTNQYMVDTKNANTGIVYVYIRKFVDATGDPAAIGHRLRFRFLDKDSVCISPNKFNATKWLDQVHGFNPAGTAPGYFLYDKTGDPNKFIEYNVAYPIPLAKVPSKFTSGGVANLGGGDVAHAEFSYTRIGFGGFTETGKIIQDFNIYEKGDWEIVYHFKTVNPKFDND
jgi:hypothetical protein